MFISPLHCSIKLLLFHQHHWINPVTKKYAVKIMKQNLKDDILSDRGFFFHTNTIVSLFIKTPILYST